MVALNTELLARLGFNIPVSVAREHKAPERGMRNKDPVVYNACVTGLLWRAALGLATKSTDV